MKAFIDETNQPPAKVMMLGPTSSSEAVVIADVSKYMGIVEVRGESFFRIFDFFDFTKPLSTGSYFFLADVWSQ